MKLSSKIAATFLVVASLSVGQTLPANDSPAVPGGGVSSPASLAPAPVPETAAPLPAQSEPVPPSAAQLANIPAGKPARAITAQKKIAATADAASGVKPPGANADTPLYVLGPLDVVAVTVFDEKNVSGTYAIGPDGRISMPLIGTFKCIGMTIPELTELVAQKLRDDGGILEPVVNVQLLRSNSKQYTLIGGLLRTGPIPLTRETTILDAVAAAGGLKEFANPKKIVLRRGTKDYPFNYKDVIKGKHLEQNIMIQDGDLIIVPE